MEVYQIHGKDYRVHFIVRETSKGICVVRWLTEIQLTTTPVFSWPEIWSGMSQCSSQGC